MWQENMEQNENCVKENAVQLGFGIMRLPQNNGQIEWGKAERMIDEYMKGDFCYFDLHPAYMNGKAQTVLRELIVKKYGRESFYIANKMPYYVNNRRDYEMIFAKELEECGVEYFDYYMLHAITQDVYEMHEQLDGFSFLSEKKKEGKVKNIGVSFHDKPKLLEEILKDHPEIDFVQLQINFLDWESPVICSKYCYQVARKYNKKIIVMEPIKGGSLANSIKLNGNMLTSSELAKLALQFVAELDGISIILSGMTELIHVIENRKNLASLKKENSLSIYSELREQISQEEKIPCTKCMYCMRECPKNISIPNIISLLNSCHNVGENDYTFMGRYRIFYKGYINQKGKASDCIHCGKCESKCPQKLKIRDYLKEAVGMFENMSNGNYYTSERNVQILIYLMKAHGIKKIVASPGTTNICLVHSVQQDDFFEVYSAADERSAAYIACGLAAESGEPVALSCTGATASRNYVSGLTEAYYRKLPILAVTSTQPEERIGHNIPQIIDRTNPLNDIAKLSVRIPMVKDEEDEWACGIAINKALLELKHHGGGPVHINLTTSYSTDFSVRNLPTAGVIRRVLMNESFPEIPKGKIGIFVGAHDKWSEALTAQVDRFCEQYNAVVICDHTSNYMGKYGVLASLILRQENQKKSFNEFTLIIHMGNVSGAYLNLQMLQAWRVNPDGEVCDTFRKLRCVFEMEEISFFEKYVLQYVMEETECTQAKDWEDEYNRIYQKMPELPFSNAWIAGQTAGVLPSNAVLHLGILNSLRSWNFFRIPEGVAAYSNTGGFGIDGCVSALLGASLADPNKIYFGIVGDLAFFYDMNAIGNRHMGSNLRLILINNGCGTEFKNYNHMAFRFGNEANPHIAAAGHYGNKSKQLVRNYAENLGFEYYSASTKQEYMEILPKLISEKKREKPMLLEVFTNSEDESNALKIINTLNGEADESQNTVNKSAIGPLRIVKAKDKKRVVLWGTGNCFAKNLSKVEAYCHVQFACDNNQDKWGKEIVPGIQCISPKELSEIKDVFVVIMLEDVRIAFQIANQLLDMGIDSFDLVYNWLEYANNQKFE